MNGARQRRRCGPRPTTCRSSIASSSADCVFGEARLISSASTMLANSGPGWKTNVSVARWSTLTPTRSVGSRSGVNCTRFHEQSIEPASALARLVLPTPGTSSMRRWPSASRHMTARSMASRLPCTTEATLVVIASNNDAKVLRVAPGGGGGCAPGGWSNSAVMAAQRRRGIGRCPLGRGRLLPLRWERLPRPCRRGPERSAALAVPSCGKPGSVRGADVLSTQCPSSTSPSTSAAPS